MDSAQRRTRALFDEPENQPEVDLAPCFICGAKKTKREIAARGVYTISRCVNAVTCKKRHLRKLELAIVKHAVAFYNYHIDLFGFQQVVREYMDAKK